MIKNTTSLLHALREGATVVTPNNRLSNQLLRDYFSTPHPTFAALSEKPAILPYQTFLKTCFLQVCKQSAKDSHPLLLSSQQTRQLWRQILLKDATYTYHDGLLEEVQEAWIRCQHWQVKTSDPCFAYTPQTRQFQIWCDLFQKKLDALGAITEYQIVDYCLKHPQLICHTTHLIWMCFDDYPPAVRALQDALAEEGIFQESYDLTEPLGEVYQYKATDISDEWLQMVTWAKARLQEGDDHIALVIPNLQQEASALERFLKQHVTREQYNLSLGQALLSFPLVQHALEWLALDNTQFTTHQVQLLLQSPYLFGSQAEFLARAELMEKNPHLKAPFITGLALQHHCKPQAPKLAHVLESLQAYPEKASAMSWVLQFKARLSTLGYPGDYALDSALFQCFQRLMTLFDEFMALGSVQSSFTADEALQALRDLAAQTIFQLQQPETPITILGLLEASGCHADSIWVSHLTDQCLPQAVRLSAFIPHALQRDLSMPHATAARELQLATNILKRFQSAAPLVVFSYNALTKDTPNLPSPLITHFPILEAIPTATSPSVSSLQTEEEDYHLPLKPEETFTGGTALLANQAKCPFKAFAAHRLHATASSIQSEGIDARLRGQLLHQILEHLWKTLQSQERLRALSPETLDELIESTIQATLDTLLEDKTLYTPLLVKEVEQARLKRLIKAALAWETSRPDFVIDSLEETSVISLAGLPFKIRIDRKDRIIEDDSKWVIDYKTSLPPKKPWRDDQLDAPQILLYALTDNAISTLAFIQLKTGQLTCRGFSQTTLPIEGIESLKKGECWSDFQTTWHQQLNLLAETFKEGACAPTPISPSTCLQCDFRSLCRINQAQM